MPDAQKNLSDCGGQPLVTAVIPTCNRPKLLLRAVSSALSQDYPLMEVIVVIDGPDPVTETALEAIADSRLRVISLPEKSGAPVARNAGVRAAFGEWIAFLDDDDEWLPDKTTKQMRFALASRDSMRIVSSQMFVRTAGKELIWPRKNPSLPICDYLFTRSTWTYGEGILSTITLLLPRQLALDVPFTVGLPKYQDFDWVLRAFDQPGVSVAFLPEPLAIWHMAEVRGTSVSSFDDWQRSLKWLRSQQSRITRRSYAGFIATQIAPQAARQRCWSAFTRLLIDMFLRGDPTLFVVTLYFFMWLSPHWLRRIVRRSPVTSRKPASNLTVDRFPR
jgi:glycosyltransferase involved in cell wall biosynthesis